MKSRRVVIVLFFLVCITCVQAQDRDPSIFFDHYTIPGVIQSTATTSIVQDEFGLLWFGTTSGLFRFNGQEFKHYTYHSDKGLLLDERQITVLHWDKKKHRLLIGTRMAGLLEFSYHQNAITTITTRQETIHDIEQTKNGRIWVSAPNGLFELVDNNLVIVTNTTQTKGPVPLFAKGDSLWVGSVQRASLFLGEKKVQDIDFNSPGRTFPHTSRASSLLLDSKDQLWIGTEREGVLVYNIQTGKLVHEFLPGMRPFYSRINAMHQDRSGLIWMLTKAEGLAVYNPTNQQTLFFQQDIYQENTLSGNNCYSILEDKTGLLWVGTNGAINFFDREQRKFSHYENQRNNISSLSDNMVRSLFEDDGLVWVGTDGGYINILDRTKNTVQRVAIEGKDFPEHEPIVPFAFAKLDDTKVLVGTSIGLLVFDKEKKTFSHYAPASPYLKNKRIRVLLIKDRMLYGIVAGLMFRFDLTTHAYKTYRLPMRNNVNTLYVDKENRFWVGSNGAISILDTKTDSLYYTRLPRDTTNFLVLNIEQIRDKIWLSTMNYGIFEVSAKGNSISVERNITNLAGLVDNTVYATVPDDFGNVWITTNRGLCRLDPNGRFTNYQVSEGVQSEEFNRLCNLKMRDGTIVVGGINGVNSIDPLKVVTETAPLDPVIYSLTVRKATEVVELERSSVQGDSIIKLTDTETSFAIRFGVTDYRRPNRYVAEYKLEGFDEAWQKSDAFGEAVYNQLTPGYYTFKVKVTNPAGEQRTKAIGIYIKPPFWMTWWFRTILSIIVIAVAVGSFSMRTQREKKDKQRLEELLRMRTQEIEKSREQLANLNERKDLIFSILSHDLRSPLTTLKGFLGLLIEDGAMFSKEEIKKHAEMIRASVANSLDLIDNTLFWSLSQMEGLQANPVRLAITDLVKKITGLYHLAITRKGIKLNVDIESGLHVEADENMLYVILRNLVSNAIKFTPDGRSISITAYSKENRVYLEVKDEGVGMNQEYIAKLLTDVHPIIKKGTSNEKGTGLGLLLCRQFAEAIQGTLTIESKEGVGSTFILSLPMVGI